MAKTQITKPIPVVQPLESKPSVLTVIVTDSKNALAPGARVTMQPSGATGLTDNSGQIQFQLGNSPKYDVHVTLGRNTVTVPYYVVPGGASKLMVNVAHVKAVEAAIAKQQRGWSISYLGITFGIIGVIFIAVVIWVLIRRRK